MDRTSSSPSVGRQPAVQLAVAVDGRTLGEYRLEHTTIIGREPSCGVQVDHQVVSRRHLQVAYEDGRWWAIDLNSSNGTYRGKEKITRVPLDGTLSLTLGSAGPVLSLRVEGARASAPQSEQELAEYVEKVRGKHTGPVGRQTMMVQRAFEVAQAHERRRYRSIIGAVAVLLLAAGAYGLYITLQTGNERQLAQEIFYSIKGLQVEIARMEQAMLASAGGQSLEALAKAKGRRQELERNYDQFLTEIGFYTGSMAEDEKIIYRIARVFGESELAMPPGFVAEVRSYIEKWKSTKRFRTAVETARSRDYHRLVAAAMLEQDLPPQFFYLAMQESDFNPYAVGPATRFGHAKGAWQFIPSTATEYGLKIGPQFELGRPDPADERHDFAKATLAASKYLKFIYTTDAQASGLLVMASYNWGENRVIQLVRTLPDNPRDRNFWQLLTKYRDQVPRETYDYVLSIVSAAVIGENPRLFGFDFDNPLAHLDTPSPRVP